MADQYVAAAQGITLTTTATVVLNVTSTSGARRLNINEMGISFNGTSSSAVPVLVSLVRTTTVGTGSAISQAATPLDSYAPASTCTATMCSTAGAWGTAPTASSIMRTWYVSPTSGLVLQLPLGQEADGPSTSGSGFGLEVTAPAACTATAYLVWSE